VYIYLNFVFFKIAVNTVTFLLGSKGVVETKHNPTTPTIVKGLIFSKYIYFLSSRLSLAASWLAVNLRKILLFIIKHSFSHVFNFVKFFYVKAVKGFFLVWRPIFKKWSYYGVYRAYRSKWLKK